MSKVKQGVLYLISVFLLYINPVLFAKQISNNPHYTTIGAANLYDLKAHKNFILLSVKGYQQTEDYTCGPVVIMSLLKYYNKLSASELNKATELRIAQEMGTSKATGTSPFQIINWLKHHGFHVQYGENGTIKMRMVL